MEAVAAKEAATEAAAEAAAEATAATAVAAATEGVAETKAAATTKGAGATERAAAIAVAWRSTEHAWWPAHHLTSQKHRTKHLGVCRSLKVLFAIFTNRSIQQQQKIATQHIHNTQQQPK
jgi:hypothetical protein